MVEQVFTDSEAAKIWEVGLTAVIKACQGGGLNRFNERECRNSDGTFLISEAGMNRLFGERLDDQGMSIVFMHIGSEEAMLVRSKLRKIFEARGVADVEGALHERLGQVITSCVKAIANGHTVELLKTIEDVPKMWALCRRWSRLLLISDAITASCGRTSIYWLIVMNWKLGAWWPKARILKRSWRLWLRNNQLHAYFTYIK